MKSTVFTASPKSLARPPELPTRRALSARCALVFCSAILYSGITSAYSPDAAGSVESYLDLPLQDLMSIEINTVSKKQKSISETAAAVFVITQEDIRRSGYTSIPELLRMVPGFQVARNDTNTWSISSRGFNGIFANKLLVLMDGRSVYSPSFGGVYWDAQDAILADIERIEVVRGPGATLWGANAVNGIVNIITKSATETTGGLASVGLGNEDKGIVSLRYGRKLGEQTDGRAYLKLSDRDSSVSLATGQSSRDEWQGAQGGFRLDGQIDSTYRWTLQGDAYEQRYDQVSTLTQATPPFLVFADDSAKATGWNLLARVETDTSETGSASLQVYFDHANRDEIYLEQTFDTLDIDFQHSFEPTAGSELIWGLGYRRIEDDFESTFTVSTTPASDTQHLFSAFAQGEIELLEDELQLTLGSKFEHNDYTGFEYQPSIRLLWTPTARHSVWGAVSRAIRTPSRMERTGSIAGGFALPSFTPLTIAGSDDVGSETLIAYELGYRFSNGSDLAFDTALFFNRYDHVQTIDGLPSGNSVFGNAGEVDSHGVEIAVDWRPLEWWRLQGAFTWTELDMTLVPGSRDFTTEAVIQGSTPEQQWSLRSSMSLSGNWELDVWARYVDSLAAASNGAVRNGVVIDDYVSLDVRLGWRPSKNLELSLSGRNLLESRNLEQIDEGLTRPVEIQRSIYAEARFSF